MTTETSSIDDILSAQSGVKAPEMQNHYEEEPSIDEQPIQESYDYGEIDNAQTTNDEQETSDDHEPVFENETESDDYGNPKSKSRTYTEEEVNEKINKAIRERLARGSSAATSQNQPNASVAKEFEYNPDSNESWQTQLESFVEQTVSKMGQKQAQMQREAQEQEAHIQLQTKIQQGLDRFGDFREAVGSQPISDAMTMALRGMNDPAAFIYAASKRMPQELQRIAKIPDQYAQMVEMGKLEERMRQAKPATKAPRPISRTIDDGITIKKPPKREETIEDMIAAADAKRKNSLRAQRGR